MSVKVRRAGDGGIRMGGFKNYDRRMDAGRSR